MMTAMLFRLLSIAAPAAALPALLAGFLAAAAGISLIASAAWIIASAALAPPLSALALAITCVRACGIGRAVFRYLERLLSHRLAFGCYETLQQATYRRSAAVIPMREGNVREGEFLHDLAAGGLGLVAQRGEGTAAGAVRRDLGGGEPPAVDEAEQVVLGTDGGIARGRLQDTGENRTGRVGRGVQPLGGP